MSSPIPPLIIDRLSHHYHGTPVLDNISLQCQPSEFLSILGASGCGKSTLLRAIAGLHHPQRGRIMINGRTVLDNHKALVPAQQRQVGLVFQDYALFPHLNVADNIAFGLHGRGREQRRHRQERVDALLTLINLQDFATAMPSDLSGGQQQRVALARALAPKPKLLLLDEPFANIDATLRQRLGQELQQFVTQEQVTVILVTHDCSEALALADRVGVMTKRSEQGSQLIQCDKPEIIYQQPSTDTVAHMTGTASLLPATAKGDYAESMLGNLSLVHQHHGQGELMLRPENLYFQPHEQGPAKITAKMFRGACYRLQCQLGNHCIMVEQTSSQPVNLGQQGFLRVEKPVWFFPEEFAFLD